MLREGLIYIRLNNLIFQQLTMKGAIRDIGQFTSVPGDNDSVPRPPSLAGSATGGNIRSDDVASEVFLVGWKSY